MRSGFQSDQEVVTAPAVEVDQEVIRQAKLATEVERQVIVHVLIRFSETPSLIRVWPSTFLFPAGGGSPSQLLNADNITFYPTWMEVRQKQHKFTLIFEGLPKDCKSFDLVEVIPQDGGFEVQGIPRNKTDVYEVEIS